jgi:hypothetical protein
MCHMVQTSKERSVNHPPESHAAATLRAMVSSTPTETYMADTTPRNRNRNITKHPASRNDTHLTTNVPVRRRLGNLRYTHEVSVQGHGARSSHSERWYPDR